MEQKEITEAYNYAASQYVEKCFNELEYKPLDKQLLDRFSELTKYKGIICDIGCGPGQTAKYLFLKGNDVVGVDISYDMIKKAKKLNPEIKFKVDDMFNLQFENEYFVGICSFYSIVNFKYTEIKNIFKEYIRILRDDGLLLLAFHVEEKEIHVDNFFETDKPLDFYYFNENIIIQMLKETGFKILEALVRFPYEKEHPTKRAYILAKKSNTPLY